MNGLTHTANQRAFAAHPMNTTTAGIVPPVAHLGEIPTLNGEHRQVNDNLHAYLDELEKKLIPVLDMRDSPIGNTPEKPEPDPVSQMGQQIKHEVGRTRSAQQRVADIATRLCLCAALAFLLPSCSTDPATGNKTFLGKGKGEWGAVLLAGGKAAVPAAKAEFDRQTATK